jgi:acyl carrier protein
MTSETQALIDRQLLLDTWMEVLGLEQVDLEEDFFSLGGDSLTATTLMVAVLERFGVEMLETEVFWAPKFDEFFARVQEVAADVRAGSAAR